MSVIDNMIAGTWPTGDVASADTALDALSPAAGSDILIPGLPPILGEANDIIGILYNLQAIIFALTAEISYIPVLNVILFLVDLILAIISLFAGRPRQEATLNCAQNLLKARNSAANICGTNLLRMFQDWNIVISESGAGEALIAAAVAQFVNNLTGQGIPIDNARQIVLYQFTTGADNLGNIHPFLLHQTDPSTPTYGPGGFQRVYQIILNHFLKQGFAELKAEEIALKLILQYGPLKWLIRLYLGHQLGNPPPGSCPTGQHWDFTSESCVPDKTPPPPSTDWKPPPGTPPLAQPDPEGDEITLDLCKQMADNTLALIYTIYQAQQQQGGGGNQACCDEITAAIGGVTAVLNSIVSILPSLAGGSSGGGGGGGGGGDGNPDPVTCTQLTGLMNELTNAITAIAPGGGPDPNLKRIADDFDTLDGDADPEGDAFVDFLIHGGALDASFGPPIKGQ